MSSSTRHRTDGSDLIDRIRASPASPLTEALNNPLALTLIRDTYQSGDDTRELLDHCDTIQKRASGAQAAEEITGHLLDRVLPAAYAPRPGQPPPRYDLQTAQNALTKIAARMNQDSTRDLQWWRIPRWVPSAQRIVVAGLVAWLLVEVVFGFVSLVVSGIVSRHMSGVVGAVVIALVYGAVFGLVAGITAGVAARGTGGPPARIGRLGRPRLRRVFTRRSLKFGLVVGVAPGFVAGFGLVAGFDLVTGLFYGPEISFGLVLGLVLGLGFGLVAVLAGGLADAFVDPDSTSSPSPAISWRNDRRHAMAIGVVVGVVVGLVVGVVVGVVAELGRARDRARSRARGRARVRARGRARGRARSLDRNLTCLAYRLAAAQLTGRWHTPLRLMNFLDDARERNVLRTVGPVYQFRHARLQDRLAAAAINGRNNDRSAAAKCSNHSARH